MRRRNRINGEWETPVGADFKWEHVAIEVLMDIRDELKQIRSTLQCSNVLRAAKAVIRAERRLAAYQPLERKPK